MDETHGGQNEDETSASGQTHDLTLQRDSPHLVNPSLLIVKQTTNASMMSGQSVDLILQKDLRPVNKQQTTSTFLFGGQNNDLIFSIDQRFDKKNTNISMMSGLALSKYKSSMSKSNPLELLQKLSKQVTEKIIRASGELNMTGENRVSINRGTYVTQDSKWFSTGRSATGLSKHSQPLDHREEHGTSEHFSAFINPAPTFPEDTISISSYRSDPYHLSKKRKKRLTEKMALRMDNSKNMQEHDQMREDLETAMSAVQQMMESSREMELLTEEIMAENARLLEDLAKSKEDNLFLHVAAMPEEEREEIFEKFRNYEKTIEELDGQKTAYEAQILELREELEAAAVNKLQNGEGKGMEEEGEVSKQSFLIPEIPWNKFLSVRSKTGVEMVDAETQSETQFNASSSDYLDQDGYEIIDEQEAIQLRKTVKILEEHVVDQNDAVQQTQEMSAQLLEHIEKLEEENKNMKMSMQISVEDKHSAGYLDPTSDMSSQGGLVSRLCMENEMLRTHIEHIEMNSSMPVLMNEIEKTTEELRKAEEEKRLLKEQVRILYGLGPGRDSHVGGVLMGGVDDPKGAQQVLNTVNNKQVTEMQAEIENLQAQLERRYIEVPGKEILNAWSSLDSATRILTTLASSMQIEKRGLR